MPIAETSYGSNEDGLIWGYRFAPGQPAQPISSEQVAGFLDDADAKARGEFLWLHFSLANQAARRFMSNRLALPEAFHDSLGSGVGSTRLELDDGALVAVIHDVLFDSSFDASQVGTTTLCIAPRLVVSARVRPLRSIEQLRAAIRGGQVFRSPVDLLAHLLRDQASVLGQIVRKATTRVDQIEDRLLDNRVSTDREELGALRRSLVRLQRLLAPEPAALFRLLQRPPGWMAGADVDGLRGATEEFSLVLRDMQALEERIKLLQEEVAAGVNEENNRSLFVLTMVTVLALPINILAGLFGMNVGGIPLADHPHGFWVLVGVIAAFSALAAWLAFRNKR